MHLVEVQKGTSFAERLDSLFKRFCDMMEREVEIGGDLYILIRGTQKEEKHLLQDLLVESDARKKKIRSALERVSDMQRSEEKWKKTFKG